MARKSTWKLAVDVMRAYVPHSLIEIDIFFQYMMERRPWSEEQDLYLRETLEKNTLNKWSQVARLLELDYGVKGRTPKECRERYTSQLEATHPKKEWPFWLEQRMMDLHNDLGNKWAVIGHRMGGISDNAVKNHFYSLLRRALRKLNIVISREFPKEIKEFKPTVLYRIVEVADERAKQLPENQIEFAVNSHQLKNELLDFAYDESIEQTEEPEIDFDLAKELIAKVSDFVQLYKKRGRKSRKTSGQGQNLLNSKRFQRRINAEQEEESSSNMQDDQIEGEEISDKNKSRKTSYRSANADKMIQEEPLGMRTRAKSQGNVASQFVQKPNFSMTDEIPEVHEGECIGEEKGEKEGKGVQTDNVQGNISEHLEIEGILSGYQLLEEAEPGERLSMKKRGSSLSRLSLSGERRDMDFHFFDESSFQLRGLPEMDVCLRRESQVEENIFG